MIEKSFQPSDVEERIYARWEKAEAFCAGRFDRRAAKPYCIVIPPPNVTGSLHMGHALNNTLQDILARFERMRGRDVLWQPGTDHAGIATQMVVERQLMERQEPNRRTLGRVKFLEKVWAWKAESGGTITKQLKRLGASCDWSRERFTMDEGLSRAVLKVFVELYRAGLIYKDKRLVNWDPKLLTAISDLEVQQVEVKGHLWYFKYPVEDLEDTYITVATTRPETMLGDSAVAVHPTDKRYHHLVGRNAVLPLVGRRIPIIADEHSDPEKGTGAVKITPAHDFNDFEVGRRHDLPLINVLDIEGRLNLESNEAFLTGSRVTEGLNETLALHGIDRFVARKLIVERMQQAGLVEKIEQHTHIVPHGDRSGVVIEPYLTDQWYVDAETLAQPAIAAVREGRTVFVPPAQWEATFFNWMVNIQPWCISRQLWWGHQIPAWYGWALDGAQISIAKTQMFVAESEGEALAQARDYYKKDVELVATLDESLGLVGFGSETPPEKFPVWRDEDVLDTWFSSALWPFSTLGWPDETAELKAFYPTDVLLTARDILFLWVARMVFMGLEFAGDIPFDDVYVHSIVQAPDGRRMSKSLGTGIDPLALLDGGPRPPVFTEGGEFPAYGADAVRFGLLAMSSSQDVRFNEEKIAQGRQLANKLWNAARLVLLRVPADVAVPERAPEPRTVEDRWILSRLQAAKADMERAIDDFEFHHAALGLYDFVYSELADWYLEMIKPRLYDDDNREVAVVALHVLSETLAT